jgi:hypothetical protein
MSDESRRFFRLRPIDFDLGDALIQVVSVALGVILGFAVTAWSDRNHQRALLGETVGNIVAEINANQTGLRKVMNEHAKSAQILRRLSESARKPGSISLADARAALRKTGDFRENVPLDIAFQIAQGDQGLTLLPYENRYDLAWVYQVQTIYYGNEQRYQNSLLTLTPAPDGNYFFEIVDLSNQLASVVGTERLLDGLYTQALTRAKSEFKS